MSTLTHVPNVPQIADDAADPGLHDVIERAKVTKSPPRPGTGRWGRTRKWPRNLRATGTCSTAAAPCRTKSRNSRASRSLKSSAANSARGRLLRSQRPSPRKKRRSCALPNWEHPDPKTRAALHYARTLTLDDGRDKEVYEELRKFYSNAEIIELSAFFCLTAGGNRMAKSWSIEAHSEVPAIPKGAMSIHGEDAGKVHSESSHAR